MEKKALEALKTLIEKRIAKDERLGDQAGGSGHLSHTSVNLDGFEVSETTDGLQVDYRYTKYIETEFSYEPDSSGPTYKCSKSIWLDSQGNVVKESELESSQTGGFPDMGFILEE